MIVAVVHNLLKDGKVVGTLRVYFKGTGDPRDFHSLEGFSINSNAVGEIPRPHKIETMEDWKLD